MGRERDRAPGGTVTKREEGWEEKWLSVGAGNMNYEGHDRKKLS